MDPRTRSDVTGIEAPPSLAAWLRAGRDRRKLTIEDVAKITKIQARILEKLESGSFDGLPAEVFVKGFVRSFAKCVGLDEAEELSKYSAAQASEPSSQITVAKVLVETIVPLARKVKQPGDDAATPIAVEIAPVVTAAPVVAAPVTEAIDAARAVSEAAPALAIETPSKKKRSRKKNLNSAQRAKKKKSELVAQAVVDAVMPAPIAETIIEQRSIDTALIAKIAKIDGESHDASIEAKTADTIDVIPSATEMVTDGVIN